MLAHIGGIPLEEAALTFAPLALATLAYWRHR
jgi:hypothetical protein